jgi:outer membrane protein assembly factor BamE (lipoprotein component of BamABCDE complex)
MILMSNRIWELTMKSSIFLTVICFAAITLTGCASKGNESLRKETEFSIGTKLTEGQTTKAEVRKMLGSPLKTSFTDGGLEISTYEFDNVTSDAINYVPVLNWLGSSASGTKKELVILFDKGNVVQRYSMSESNVKIKTGLYNN